MREFILAVQFLTIFPVKVRGGVPEEEMALSAIFFPVVGALQGLLAVGVAYLSTRYLGEEIAAAIVVLALAVSNGGLHLDGLADTFDAIAVKSAGNGPADITRRLAAMKDSTVGPIGVIAVIFAVLLKFLFLKTLISGLNRTEFFSFLVLAGVYSRWAMVPPMYYGRSARKDGLGRIFIENLRPAVFLLATLTAIVLSGLIYGLWLRQAYGVNKLVLLLVLLCGLFLFGLASVKYSAKRFGGLTGDVFGAISEISEVIFLLGVTVWLRRFI
ncbi:MAG: adenosylcobinamide-GDP ribazoletransferase [Nitrospiraceae bacterium]|nr:adenosylcobinamide-GDP ribazoletransferase [Nitrospiraceae bacterium]